MHAIVGLSVSRAHTNPSEKRCRAEKWTSCVNALRRHQTLAQPAPMSSKPLPIIPQITLKHNKMSPDPFTYLFITHMMVRHWQMCCILIQKADSNRPSPTRFLSRKCLWSFLSVGGGQLLEDDGLGGRLATGRHLSLPAWHLPTAANLLLISSRPCAWQRRGFQISFSPRVKNPEPYHFANGYL